MPLYLVVGAGATPDAVRVPDEIMRAHLLSVCAGIGRDFRPRVSLRDHYVLDIPPVVILREYYINKR